MVLKMIAGALSLAALVACTSPAPAPSVPSPGPAGPVAGACNPQGAQFAVGKQASASVVEDARQRSGSYMARVLRPGQAVTMEFNAQRLNLDVDGAGVVVRARCG